MVICGLDGVVSASAYVYQLPLLCDMFKAAPSSTLCMVLELLHVDPSFCMSSVVLPVLLHVLRNLSSACHRLTHPEHFNCANILMCFLAFTVSCPSGEEHHFLPLGLCIQTKCLGERKVSWL